MAGAEALRSLLMSELSALDLVRDAEAARCAAMASGDLDALDALLHDDLHYGHTTGAWDTKAVYLGKLSEGTLAYPALKTTETAALVRDATVLLWIDMAATVVTPAGTRAMHNAVLTVWVVEDSTARMIAHQPTVLD